MAIKVGINGLGRIGRMVLRSIVENKNNNIDIKHINNKANSEISSFLIKYDTIHGKINAEINHDKNNLIINNAGTISGNGNYPVSFRSSDNSTLTNSGTIFGQVSVIYLRDANDFTLTNESTGKIYTTYSNTIKSQEATDGIVIHNYGKIYGGATGVEKQLVITIEGGTDANQGPKLYNYSGRRE